jgi:hypothetical protein
VRRVWLQEGCRTPWWIVIATFNTTTGWAGRTISYESGYFILEGHGPIAAADLVNYDLQGQLIWARGDLRAWAMQLGAPAVVAPQTVAIQTQQVAYQVPKDKSVGAALVLTFFFGPLGLLYCVPWWAALLMFLGAIVLALPTLGFAVAVIWVASMIWGAVAASKEHTEFQVWLAQQTQTYMRVPMQVGDPVPASSPPAAPTSPPPWLQQAPPPAPQMPPPPT